VSRRRTIVAVTAAGLVALSVSTAVSAAAAPSPGAQGAGDPYFPMQGNGGYDVAHYDLAIDYTPGTKALTGVANITATATQDLSRFDLDLRRSMTVTQVLVDGRPATFTQPARLVQELVVTPPTAIRSGRGFTVRVTYGGTAAPTRDPDGSLDGFIPTSDGAFVASEPQGSPTWFPCNDTPTDKATYTLAVTTPSGIVAIGNGTRIANRTGADSTTSVWSMTSPISTYLVTATIGKFDVSTGRTPGGVPYLTAVDPAVASGSASTLAALPDVVDWFSSVYGPYPFESAGAIVDNASFVGYALETATRPVFDSTLGNVSLLSHELAHQWFGDTVTLAQWRDIWLNEGFAEFSSWLYTEHTGGATTADRLDRVLALPADDAVWTPPPANPGSGRQIFADSVYTRGAAALAALREKIGDAAFFKVMKGWVAAHRYGNATVDDFRTYAERVSGVELTNFFQVWLDRRAKPTSW
jgi:aminopeptidase N